LYLRGTNRVFGDQLFQELSVSNHPKRSS